MFSKFISGLLDVVPDCYVPLAVDTAISVRSSLVVRLQAQLNRGGCNPVRCCRVILENFKRLAVCRRRDPSLAKRNPRAHKAGPTLDVSRRAFQAMCQAIDNRSDCVALVWRRRFRLG